MNAGDLFLKPALEAIFHSKFMIRSKINVIFY